MTLFEPFLHPEYLQGPEPHAGLDPLSGGEIWAGWARSLRSAVQLPRPAGVRAGIPRNPFINAGALVVSDLLKPGSPLPPTHSGAGAPPVCGNPAIMADQVVARSGVPALRPQCRHRLSDEGLWQLRERGGQGIAELLQCLRHPHELRRSGTSLRLSGQPGRPSWREARPCCRPGPPSRSMPRSPPAASMTRRATSPTGSACRGNPGWGRHHGADPRRAFHLRLVTRAQQGGQLPGRDGGAGAAGRAPGPLHF